MIELVAFYVPIFIACRCDTLLYVLDILTHKNFIRSGHRNCSAPDIKDDVIGGISTAFIQFY